MESICLLAMILDVPFQNDHCLEQETLPENMAGRMNTHDNERIALAWSGVVRSPCNSYREFYKVWTPCSLIKAMDWFMVSSPSLQRT